MSPFRRAPLAFSTPHAKRVRKRIEIGLVNNMGDLALKATERQFRTLAAAAGNEFDLRFRVFALERTPRSAWARDYIAARYEPATAIFGSELHALIITGAQPQTDRLNEELYWEELVELIEWAKLNTTSTIFSCLAAHAAVLHLDGIQRRRLEEKCTGVFAFTTKRTDPLVGTKGSERRIPHSRYNGLIERELEQSGYCVLSASHKYGVDAFVKSFGSLFVFLQGHPEYEANSLAREYRRDVNAYLNQETSKLPFRPENYFGIQGDTELRELQDLRYADGLAADHLFKIDSFTPFKACWREAAVSFFRNWLDGIAEGVGHSAAASASVEAREFVTP